MASKYTYKLEPRPEGGHIYTITTPSGATLPPCTTLAPPPRAKQLAEAAVKRLNDDRVAHFSIH